MSRVDLDRMVPSTERAARRRGVYLAIVTANTDEGGDSKYQIKVKYPWLPPGDSGEEASFWARILVPMAGARRGTYFLPEVDDQVLVVFEHGDVSRPIVVGGIWSTEQAPPQRNDDGKNNIKVIKSKSGHRIIFDDTEGSERLVVVDSTTVPVSAAFHYAVHARSLLPVEDVEVHFKATHDLALELSDGISPDYFGLDALEPPRRLDDAGLEALYDPRAVQAAYLTPEIGLDTEALMALLRIRVLAEPLIRVRTATEVRSASPAYDAVSVESICAGEPAAEQYDHVVNALWGGRLAVDRTAGLLPARPWLHRIKHYLRVRAHAAGVPTTTILLGPFGDLVAWPNGEMFLSWYPVGMRDTSTATTPPAWPDELFGADADTVRSGTWQALTSVMPALADLDPSALAAARVKGGVIFAWGHTDIDDPDSVLHERYAIGVQSTGRYHTIDTGKLTMAPHFGQVVADRILGCR